LLELGGRGALDKVLESHEKMKEGGGLTVNPLSAIGSRTPMRTRDRPFRTQPAVPNNREKPGKCSYLSFLEKHQI
jgi:hypothetical protein